MRILSLFVTLCLFSCTTEDVEPVTSPSSTKKKIVNNKAKLVITGKGEGLKGWSSFYVTNNLVAVGKNSQSIYDYKHGGEPFTIECHIGDRDLFELVLNRHEYGQSGTVFVKVYKDSTVYY